VVHPTDENLVYAATPSGLYRTTDTGQNWTNLGNPGLRAVRLYPEFPDTILVGGDSGVFISTNSGHDWSSLNAGLDGRKVNCLEFAVTDEIGLFAGTNGGATYLYSFTTGISTPPKSVVKTQPLVVCPNPTPGHLMVLWNESLKPPLLLRIWDVSGRMVWSSLETVNGQLNLVLPNNIRTGVYYLELTNTSERVSTKIMITR